MYMAFLSAAERSFLRAVSQFAYCNPFLPEHTEFERAALGDDFVEGEPVWSQPVEDPERPRANVWRIFERLAPLAEQLRDRLRAGASPREPDLILYEDAILHLLYQRYYPRFYEAGFGTARDQSGRWRFYHDYLADWRRFFELDGVRLPTHHEPRHTFACFRQIQRAFDQIFRDIIGGSIPAARLRAAIWQSVFTHDMRRYRRTLYERMGEFATLITGPSGTGKELAARAIAALGVSPEAARAALGAVLPAAMPVEMTPGHVPFDSRAMKVLELTLREALALGHNYIGTEHILLGLLDEEESLGGGTLAGLGITTERARDWLVPVLEQMAAAKRQGGQPA